MPKSTWSRLFDELTRIGLADQQNPPQPGRPTQNDQFRRLKISEVELVTKRPLIVYATACTSGKQVPPEALMIDPSDRIGFKSVTEAIDPVDLDILIHSAGGYPEATESIVQQLRSKYSNIRFIVPSYAKSAATMLAMSGNEILMDRDAELGPIDPQMRTQTGTSPAEAIQEQFKKIQSELQADPTKLPSFLPILAPLGPSLLLDSQHAIELSKQLVRDWTKQYMFAGDAEAEQKSAKISDYLGDHSKFKSHARAVKISDLIPLGVKVTDIRSNPALYRAVDELYCVLDIMFAITPICKIFENSLGAALVRSVQMQVIQVQPQLQQAIPPPNSTPNSLSSQ
jgi:hypothetical protein